MTLIIYTPKWIISGGSDGYIGEPIYWNNDNGWCMEIVNATVFTHEEREEFNLPMGDYENAPVIWEQLPEYI